MQITEKIQQYKPGLLEAIGLILFLLIIASCKHDIPIRVIEPPVDGGEQTCSADTVYFQNKVLPLIVSSCAKPGCHDAISRQDGIELTSYDKIMASGEVRPGDPNNSDLYEVLNETRPDKIMPRPPSAPLTAAEKAIIYKWIQQGAKNNACNVYCREADPEYDARYRIWLDSPKGKAAGSPSKQEAIFKDKELLLYVTETCAKKCAETMNPSAVCK